jgi:lysophospholipase L1-like esterase
MGEILDDCDARHKSCLVAVQPNRALTAAHIGADYNDIISQKRVKQLYDLLFTKIEKSAHRSSFIDLTHAFDSAEKIKFYADEVHPNDHGQRLLAEMLFEPALALVTSGAARTVATNRCHRPG